MALSTKKPIAPFLPCTDIAGQVGLRKVSRHKTPCIAAIVTPIGVQCVPLGSLFSGCPHQHILRCLHALCLPTLVLLLMNEDSKKPGDDPTSGKNKAYILRRESSGVWKGWGYGIAFFSGSEFSNFGALKFGKNRSFCGISRISLEISASEKHLLDSGKWPFHTPPIHTPLSAGRILGATLPS